MADDERIIELFFRRSEQAIRELDMKYGKVCHTLSYNIINDKQGRDDDGIPYTIDYANAQSRTVRMIKL